MERCYSFKGRIATFFTMVHSIFIIITANFFLTHKSVNQFTCREQKAPDNSEVHRALKNSVSAVWNWIYVTMLEPVT